MHTYIETNKQTNIYIFL